MDGDPLPEFVHVLPYVGPTTLTRAKTIIDGIESIRWINLMLGSRFTKAECLARQGDLVAEFRNPIVRANEIRRLVENAIPKSAP